MLMFGVSAEQQVDRLLSVDCSSNVKRAAVCRQNRTAESTCRIMRSMRELDRQML